MLKNLLTAYSGEGATDRAFLGNIIFRTLERLVLESDHHIDIEIPTWYGIAKGLTIASVALKAGKNGMQLLFAHADTDSKDYDKAFAERFKPAMDQLAAQSEYCPIVVPVLVMQETEAWMLADIDVLLKELGGRLKKQDLQLSPNPESYANPKKQLDIIIRKANANQRRDFGIKKANLYLPLSNNISLKKLDRLLSYQKFVTATRVALVQIGYLRPA